MRFALMLATATPAYSASAWSGILTTVEHRWRSPSREQVDNNRAQQHEHRRNHWQPGNALKKKADAFAAQQQSYQSGAADAADFFADEMIDKVAPASRYARPQLTPYLSTLIDGVQIHEPGMPPFADETGTGLSRSWEDLVWGMLGVVGLAVGAVVLLAMFLAALAVYLLIDMRRESSKEATSPLHKARTPPPPPTPRADVAELAPQMLRPTAVLTSPEPAYVTTPTSTRALVREIRTRLSERLEIQQQATRTPSPPTSPVPAGNTPSRRVSSTATFANAIAQLGLLADPEIAALANDMSELGEVWMGLEQVTIAHSVESQAKSDRLRHLEERLERMSTVSVSLHDLEGALPADADNYDYGASSGETASPQSDRSFAALDDLHDERSFDKSNAMLSFEATTPKRWSSDHHDHAIKLSSPPPPTRGGQALAAPSQRDTDSSESDATSLSTSPR
jgi:hypothetical protein